MYIKECLLSDWTQATMNKTFTFYDSFSFVDRLTSKKLNFKDVRKNSQSLTSGSKKSINFHPRKSEKSQLKSNLSIYKKTKQFEMNSLKQRIFKKNQEDLNNQILSGGEQFNISSGYKKKMRALIDKSVQSLNRKEFRKIAQQTQSFHVNSDIIKINKQINRTKTSLNPRKINQIMKLEDQHGQVKRQKRFEVKKQFFSNNYNLQDEKSNNPTQFKTQQSKKFFQKMITYAKNQITRQGQYLIAPSKQKKKNDILLRKCKKPNAFLLKPKKQNSSCLSDLTNNYFMKFDQTNLVKQIKNQINIKNRLSTEGNQDQKIYQKMIVMLVKQNYVSNLNIQLQVNSKAIWVKDEKNNNLIHLSIKHQNDDILSLLFKKLDKKKIIKLLQEKNIYKKTPKKLAQILVNKAAIQVIQNFQKLIKSTYFLDLQN